MPAVILISIHSEADFADLIAESPSAGFLSKSELSADGIGRIVTAHANREPLPTRSDKPTSA